MDLDLNVVGEMPGQYNYTLKRVSGFLSLFVLFLLLYKNVLVVFVPADYVRYSILSVMLLLFFFCAVMFLHRVSSFVYLDFVQLSLFTFALLLVGNAALSFFYFNYGVSIGYVVKALSQLFLPCLMLAVFLNLKVVNRKLLVRFVYISVPIFLFAIVEPFLPVSLIKDINSSVMLSKIGRDIPFESGSYIFQDFGFYFIRSGSLFFEPLTLSIFSAQIVVLVVALGGFKITRMLCIFALVLSIGKSGFLIAFGSLSALLFKKYFLYISSMFFLLFVFVLGYICFEYGSMILSAGVDFYTLGPHVKGLLSGFINGAVHPFLGHGLGTSGFLVYSQSLVDGDMYLFNNPVDLVPGNGTESFYGVMVYQLGYVFFAIYCYLNFIALYFLIKRRCYIVAGYAFSFFFIGFLTESVVALLLFVSNYLIVFYFAFGDYDEVYVK